MSGWPAVGISTQIPTSVSAFRPLSGQAPRRTIPSLAQCWEANLHPFCSSTAGHAEGTSINHTFLCWKQLNELIHNHCLWKALGARSPIGSKALTPWPRRPNDRPRAKLSGRPSKTRTFGTLRLCLLQVSSELDNWKTSEPHRIAARISLQHALRIQHNFHKIHKMFSYVVYHICHDVSQQEKDKGHKISHLAFHLEAQGDFTTSKLLCFTFTKRHANPIIPFSNGSSLYIYLHILGTILGSLHLGLGLLGRLAAWAKHPIKAGDTLEDALVGHGISAEALCEAGPQWVSGNKFQWNVTDWIRCWLILDLMISDLPKVVWM